MGFNEKKKKEKKAMLCNGGRSTELGNVWSPPFLHWIQEPLYFDLVSGIKIDL